MGNELATLGELFSGDNAILTQTEESLKTLSEMSKAGSFLPRLQLYSKGKTGPKGTIIEPGHYGIPRSEDEIEDLGKSVDVLAICYKPKAIDMSNREMVLVYNDPKNKEFERIREAADNTKDSGCAWGPTYLVYERSTSGFYEFFCGSKSARYESSKISVYLPVTQDMVKRGLTKEKKPRFSKPLTLGSQYMKRGNWDWFAPKASDCLTPFDFPSKDQIIMEVERFRKIEEPEVETVDEDTKSKRQR